MLFLRRILFTLFGAAYLVTCPLTVLYALGYVLRPEGGSGDGVWKYLNI